MQYEPGFKDGSMLAEDAEFAKDWLAGDSNYQAIVESLYDSDPRLRHRDPKAITERIPWSDHGRVVILEMGPDGSFGETTAFTDVDSLAVRLTQMRSERRAARRAVPPAERTPRRTVYMVEGLGPGYVGLIGEHLGLHPSAFLDQERVIVMNTAAQGESDSMLLPSLSCPTGVGSSSRRDAHEHQRHATLKYYETMQFSHCPDNFRLVCGDTGRHIGVSRVDGDFVDVGVVRRKCTLWSRRSGHANNNCDWDCVVLCDPPVRCVRTGFEYRDLIPVTTSPYQGGYVDFVPQWAQISRPRTGPGAAATHSRTPGPPRTCFLDDLVFYLQEHAADLIVHGAYASQPTLAMADPDIVVGTFVRKIVASQYSTLASHVRAVLSGAQRALSRKHDLAALPMEKVEELWSDTQASERRVGEYGEDLEANMLKLGIPLEKPSPGRKSESSSSGRSGNYDSTLAMPYSSSALSLHAPTHLSPAASPALTPVRNPPPLPTSTPTRRPLHANDPTQSPEITPLHRRSDTGKTLVGTESMLLSPPSSLQLSEDYAERRKRIHDAYTEIGEENEEAVCDGAGGGEMGIYDDDDYNDDNDDDFANQHEDELRYWIGSYSVDYQFLLLRFRELRHRTECLNSAVTGLASITGNRQAYHEQQLALETARRSIREAKSSKAVTLLGLIFIPLAYTSSLFSMTEPYGPGGKEFWQYFATSAPLILIVLVAYSVLDAGYTDDGTSWSLDQFVRTARRWCGRRKLEEKK